MPFEWQQIWRLRLVLPFLSRGRALAENTLDLEFDLPEVVPPNLREVDDALPDSFRIFTGAVVGWTIANVLRAAGRSITNLNWLPLDFAWAHNHGLDFEVYANQPRDWVQPHGPPPPPANPPNLPVGLARLPSGRFINPVQLNPRYGQGGGGDTMAARRAAFEALQQRAPERSDIGATVTRAQPSAPFPGEPPVVGRIRWAILETGYQHRPIPDTGEFSVPTLPEPVPTAVPPPLPEVRAPLQPGEFRVFQGNLEFNNYGYIVEVEINPTPFDLDVLMRRNPYGLKGMWIGDTHYVWGDANLHHDTLGRAFGQDKVLAEYIGSAGPNAIYRTGGVTPTAAQAELRQGMQAILDRRFSRAPASTALTVQPRTPSTALAQPGTQPTTTWAPTVQMVEAIARFDLLTDAQQLEFLNRLAQGGYAGSEEYRFFSDRRFLNRSVRAAAIRDARAANALRRAMEQAARDFARNRPLLRLDQWLWQGLRGIGVTAFRTVTGPIGTAFFFAGVELDWIAQDYEEDLAALSRPPGEVSRGLNRQEREEILRTIPEDQRRSPAVQNWLGGFRVIVTPSPYSVFSPSSLKQMSPAPRPSFGAAVVENFSPLRDAPQKSLPGRPLLRLPSQAALVRAFGQDASDALMTAALLRSRYRYFLQGFLASDSPPPIGGGGTPSGKRSFWLYRGQDRELMEQTLRDLIAIRERDILAESGKKTTIISTRALILDTDPSTMYDMLQQLITNLTLLLQLTRDRETVQ